MAFSFIMLSVAEVQRKWKYGDWVCLQDNNINQDSTVPFSVQMASGASTNQDSVLMDLMV